jgi:hypothetical protein
MNPGFQDRSYKILMPKTGLEIVKSINPGFQDRSYKILMAKTGLEIVILFFKVRNGILISEFLLESVHLSIILSLLDIIDKLLKYAFLGEKFSCIFNLSYKPLSD